MSDFKSYLNRPSFRNRTVTGVDLTEVLFEMVAIGNAVKVSAIDPATNTEVSVFGSIHMSPFTLKMNAMRKLQAAVRKKRAG